MMYDGKPHRIRFSYENDIWEGHKRKLRSIELIHKEKIENGTNLEHHKSCSLEEANELVKLATKRIGKVRHIYTEDVKYEIDVFLNISLIMMEAEVRSLEQELFIPERIMPEIITEVTGIPGFDNYNLSYTI